MFECVSSLQKTRIGFQSAQVRQNWFRKSANNVQNGQTNPEIISGKGGNFRGPSANQRHDELDTCQSFVNVALKGFSIFIYVFCIENKDWGLIIFAGKSPRNPVSCPMSLENFCIILWLFKLIFCHWILRNPTMKWLSKYHEENIFSKLICSFKLSKNSYPKS